MIVSFTDTEREQVLLTLAFLALDRPAFAEPLRSLAGKFDGWGTFDAYVVSLAHVARDPRPLVTPVRRHDRGAERLRGGA